MKTPWGQAVFSGARAFVTRLLAFTDAGASFMWGNLYRTSEDLVTFINPDLAINMHRAPTSEWIGASFVSRWESSSIGLSTATLFDDSGPLGSAQQCLLLQRPAPPPG